MPRADGSKTVAEAKKDEQDFNKALAKWAKKSKPLEEAARASERIIEDDLRIVINARAD